MLADEDFFLEDLCALAFFDAGDFEDLGCVEPRVGAAAHHSYAVDFHFVYVDAAIDRLRCVSSGNLDSRCGNLRSIFVVALEYLCSVHRSDH